MTNAIHIRQQRVLALMVPCTYCGAKQYDECINTATKQPLVNISAHYARVKAATEKGLF